MPLPPLLPPAPSHPCKFCGHAAPRLGGVDFNRFATYDRAAWKPSGRFAHYHACPSCRSVFTPSFDAFTPADWAAHVYNDGYRLVDGDYYNGSRAKNYADAAVSMLELAGLPGTHKSLNVLDYGGGNGQLTSLLLARGWGDKAAGGSVTVYDPFVPAHATPPTRPADFILAVEVFEHVPDPAAMWAELDRVSHPHTLILFTTLFAPVPPPTDLIDWWYLAPRNGHITIYSRQALITHAARVGFKLHSFDHNNHLLYRNAAPWSQHLFAGTRQART